MKIPVKSKTEFEPAPEYTGRAVCVDVTDLFKISGQYGEHEVFKFVFEIDVDRPDGSRYCVWSAPLSPKLSEKSGLRKFLRLWFGRDFTKDELSTDFDTETLIGKAAFVNVVHNVKDDGTTYANLALCTPLRGMDPLRPSGKYIRKKDRGTEGDWNPEGKDDGKNYRQTTPGAKEPSDHGSIKVHVGSQRGLELRELNREAIQKLIDNWYAKEFAKKDKPSADDRRLAAALEKYREEFTKKVEEEDNVPMDY